MISATGSYLDVPQPRLHMGNDGEKEFGLPHSDGRIPHGFAGKCRVGAGCRVEIRAGGSAAAITHSVCKQLDKYNRYTTTTVSA